MANQSLAYFDHEADIGIIGYGSTLEEAFTAAASATFAIMTDLSKIKPLQTIQFEFEENDIELAFVTWLNRLITESKRLGLIFCEFHLLQRKDMWYGKALGEPWRDEHVRGTEVKGATLTMLQVKKNSQWKAQCVVDV